MIFDLYISWSDDNKYANKKIDDCCMLWNVIADDRSETSVSRKANGGFGLIPFCLVDNGEVKSEEFMSSSSKKAREACVCYTLPNQSATKLFL